MSRLSHDARHYSSGLGWMGMDGIMEAVVVAKVEEEIAVICMAEW